MGMCLFFHTISLSNIAAQGRGELLRWLGLLFNNLDPSNITRTQLGFPVTAFQPDFPAPCFILGVSVILSMEKTLPTFQTEQVTGSMCSYCDTSPKFQSPQKVQSCVMLVVRVTQKTCQEAVTQRQSILGGSCVVQSVSDLNKEKRRPLTKTWDKRIWLTHY